MWVGVLRGGWDNMEGCQWEDNQIRKYFILLQALFIFRRNWVFIIFAVSNELKNSVHSTTNIRVTNSMYWLYG